MFQCNILRRREGSIYITRSKNRLNIKMIFRDLYNIIVGLKVKKKNTDSLIHEYDI